MKHTDLADFDDDGQLIKLNIDWHEFEVDFDTYFNGGQGLTDGEWERVWFAVNKLCGDEYQIQSLDDKYKVGLIPEPTREESQDQIKSLCANYINSIFWRVERYDTQKIIEVETSDNEETYLSILRYIQYLRDYDKQSGEWWTEAPKTFEEWDIINKN